MKRTDYNPNDIIRNDDRKQFLHSKNELNVETAHINMRESCLFPYKEFIHLNDYVNQIVI